MGGFRDQFRANAMDFRKFFHQVRLGLQASRSIHNTNVRLGFQSSLDSLISDGSRWSALLSLDDVGANTIRPNTQLLNCGRAKRVSCTKHHFFALFCKMVCQFRDRRCFPGAIHSNHHDDGWAILLELNWRIILIHNLADGRLCLFDKVRHQDFTATELSMDRVTYFTRRPGPHIGFHKMPKQFGQKLIVDESAFFADKIANVRVEHGPRFLHRPLDCGESGSLIGHGF